MGRGLLVVVFVVLFLFAFYDLIATPKQQVRFLPKTLWFLVILVSPVGPVLWLFFGQQHPQPAGPSSRGPRPTGPDDDPDFLGRF